MNRLWPWETKQLGKHHTVTRPWRPLEDRRVWTAVAVMAGSAAIAWVCRLQGREASPVAHGIAVILASGLLLWGWRAWKG